MTIPTRLGLLCLILAFASNVRGQIPIPPLTVELQPDQQVTLAWRDDGIGFVLEATSDLSDANSWTRVPQVAVLSGDGVLVPLVPTGQSRFFRLASPTLTRATAVSPVGGETGVAVTRETIVEFDTPLAADVVISTANFYAGIGGRKLLSRVELSSDRTRATLFYLEPLPGSSRVSVVFDGTGLKDKLGRLLDADDDGLPGGAAVFSFETLSLTPITGTAVVGRVFASELVPGPDTGTNAVNKPLAGVTITVDGMEQAIRAVTDAQGNFTLNNTPAGRFFVHIDGRTVSDAAAGIHYPDKAYYPFVGKAWDAVAGRTDNKAGGTGELFLPLITAGTLQPVSAVQDTTITFPSAVLAKNPALNGVSITVPANSLYSDNGTRGGKVGIAAVPPDRLPGPLPPGLEPPIVITVQTDGGLNFDTPAPVCFPNLPDPVLKTPLLPGSKQALLSFNHDKGIWEAVGSMTVSADGKFICTDPGVGILQPGWHGVGPSPTDPPPCGEGLCCLGADDKVGPISPVGGRVGEAGPKPANCKPNPCKGSRVQCDRRCYSEWTDCNSDSWHAFETCIHITYRDPDCDGKELSEPCQREIKKCYRLSSAMEKPRCRREYLKCELKCTECDPPAFSRRVAKQGPDDDLAAQVMERLDEVLVLVQPFLDPQVEIPNQVKTRVIDLLAEADALAGGDADLFLERYSLALEEQLASFEADGGEDPGNAPAYPVLYSAEIARPGGMMTLRGETAPFGQYSLFVPRDGELLYVSFYDPHTKQFGIAYPRLRAAVPHRMPRFVLRPLDETFPDSDHDGLQDAVEFVYGTDATIPDSDGDGILDGAEVDQGTNPLDGRPVTTGIIASVKTPGPALDVWAGNDLVVTAEGTGGVSMFNAYQGMAPTLIAHIPVPGVAQRVTATGNFVAVAAGDAGLAILNVGTPDRVTIIHQVRLSGAQAVAAGTGTVYVGSGSGWIMEVHPASGLVLRRLRIDGPVRDLFVSGEILWALTTERLSAISLQSGPLQVVGSVAAKAGVRAHRLFVGSDIAYAAHTVGYNTFDLTNPAQPVLLGTGNTQQFGWRQIVPNGSGLGLAVVGLNFADDPTHDLNLYDVSDPRKNDVFVALFPTPGIAHAVTLYNGLAYLADDTAGLQVINYLAYDAKGIPPTISLTTSAVGDTVEASRKLRLTATAADDVQVRAVEFYVDGQLAFRDGNFPFEHWLVPPLPGPTKTNLTLRARAVDTGGNSTWSSEVVLKLGSDTTAPRILATSPLEGTRSLSRVDVLFSEAIAPATLNSASFQLISAGNDGQLDTADDAPVAGGVVSYDAGTLVAALDFPAPLPNGLYRALVRSAVTDLAGNHLAGDVVSQIRVADAVFWISGIDGFWDEDVNWSEGAVPGENDNVVIDVAAGEVTVSHVSGTSVIKSLVTREQVLLRDGILQVTGMLELQAPLTLDGGTLKSATVIQNGAARLLFLNAARNTLDGVSVVGDLELTKSTARAVIRNGLALTGSVILDKGGAITFSGDQTFNSANVIFAGDSGALGIEPNTTLTLGPAIVIRGRSGTIGQGSFIVSPTRHLINQGLIASDIAGGQLTINATTFENAGRIESKNGGAVILMGTWHNANVIDASGGTLTFEDTWANSGTISATDATVDLGGAFSLSDLGTFNRTGGTVNLSGVLNLNGVSLTLDAATGPWRMTGGTLKGGTVTQAGAKLVFALGARNTLDGVSIVGDLELTDSNARAVIRNGLALTGNVILDKGGAITFSGDQTFNSTQVIFAGDSGALGIEPNTTLTLGPAIVVRGKSGSIGQGSFVVSPTRRLINQGLIAVDVAGGTLTVNPTQLENTGSLRADGAGAILLIRADPFTNNGTIQELNGGKVLINP